MTTHAPTDVFEAMHDLLHVYRAHLVRSLAAFHPDLTQNEVRALMFVGRHPGTTQRDLVAHSGADKAQVARMVAALQDKGLLESAPNAEDKRSRCLRLSAQGAALHGALRDARRELATLLLGGCDHATQTQLLGLLARVRSHVETFSELEKSGSIRQNS